VGGVALELLAEGRDGFGRPDQFVGEALGFGPRKRAREMLRRGGKTMFQ